MVDKRTRTLNQAHARIDDVEKDVIATTTHDIFELNKWTQYLV